MKIWAREHPFLTFFILLAIISAVGDCGVEFARATTTWPRGATLLIAICLAVTFASSTFTFALISGLVPRRVLDMFQGDAGE